jgi:hypothetical protein
VFCAKAVVAQTATLADSASAKEYLMVISISFQKLRCVMLENQLNSVQKLPLFWPSQADGFQLAIA